MSKQPIFIVSIAAFWGMFTLGFDNFLMAALLPEIGQTLKAEISTVSLGISLYDLAYILAGPLCYYLYPKASAYNFLKISISLFLVGTIGTLLAKATAVFLVSRTIAGMGASLWTPLAVSQTLYRVSRDQEGKALGQIWGAQSAGSFVGVPMGLAIQKFTHWQGPYFLIAMLGALTLYLQLRQITNVKQVDIETMNQKSRSSHSSPRILLAAGFFTATASLGLYSFISEIFISKNEHISIKTLWWAAGGIIGNYILGPLIDLIDQSRTILLTQLSILSLIFLLLPNATNPHLQHLLLFTWGMIGWSLIIPLQSLLIENTALSLPLLISKFSSAMALGSGLGTALNSWLIQLNINIFYLPLIASAELGLALIILFVDLYQNQTKKNQEETLCPSNP